MENSAFSSNGQGPSWTVQAERVMNGQTGQPSVKLEGYLGDRDFVDIVILVT